MLKTMFSAFFQHFFSMVSMCFNFLVQQCVKLHGLRGRSDVPSQMHCIPAGLFLFGQVVEALASMPQALGFFVEVMSCKGTGHQRLHCIVL
jgi:hypothetical protein